MTGIFSKQNDALLLSAAHQAFHCSECTISPILVLITVLLTSGPHAGFSLEVVRTVLEVRGLLWCTHTGYQHSSLYWSPH
jgi:hypothetical protein